MRLHSYVPGTVHTIEELAVSARKETKRILETSEKRRNRRVDELLRDSAVKAVVQRDQRPQRKNDDDEKSPRRKSA